MGIRHGETHLTQPPTQPPPLVEPVLELNPTAPFENEARLSPRLPAQKKQLGKKGMMMMMMMMIFFMNILLYGGGYDGVMCSNSKMEG